MKKATKNRSGKTVEQLAVSIFGKQKANKILNTTVTKKDLKEPPYTAEEKADDAAIKAQIKKLIKAEQKKVSSNLLLFLLLEKKPKVELHLLQ